MVNRKREEREKGKGMRERKRDERGKREEGMKGERKRLWKG